MIPEGLCWNQAEIPSGPHPLKEGIVTLFTFTKNRSPRIIGTAFLVNASKSKAVAITAAHNFEAVREIQSGPRRHHPTTPPDFLVELEPIDLDRKRLRVSCLNRHGVEVALIDWAAWDQSTDIALFGVSTQDSNSEYFDSFLWLEKQNIKIGDQVVLLGYAEMEVFDEEQDKKGFERFSLSQRFVLREGHVTDLYLDGHILCKGPCIETSIPVFPGMSGGPAFLASSEGENIKPFGIISSDPENQIDLKNDRSQSGSSIIALIDIETNQISNIIQNTLIKLGQALVHKRDE